MFEIDHEQFAPMQRQVKRLYSIGHKSFKAQIRHIDPTISNDAIDKFTKKIETLLTDVLAKTNSNQISSRIDIDQIMATFHCTSKMASLLAQTYVSMIIGGLKGDEGKGLQVVNRINKLIQSNKYQTVFCVGASGGSNAGHTFTVQKNNKVYTYDTHFLTSGLANPECKNFIGRCKLCNPHAIFNEWYNLIETRPDRPALDSEDNLLSKIFISNEMNVTIIPFLIEECLSEARKGKNAVGTTRQGIATTQSAFMMRLDIRLKKFIDLKSLDDIKEYLRKLYSEYSFEHKYLEYSTYLSQGKIDPFFIKEITQSYELVDGKTKPKYKVIMLEGDTYETFLQQILDLDAKRIDWFIQTFKNTFVDTDYFEKQVYYKNNDGEYRSDNDLPDKGLAIVFEGVQSVHLDPNQGPRNCVTSSFLNPNTGFTESLGVPLTDLFAMGSQIDLQFVAKSIPSSVGNHYDPTTFDTVETKIGNLTNVDFAKVLGEFGVTSGRTRSLFYFDILLLNSAIHAFRIPVTKQSKMSIVFTRLDTYNMLKEIPICVGYVNKANGKILTEANYHFLEQNKLYQPIYMYLPGWNEFNFVEAKSLDNFPIEAQYVIKVIEKFTLPITTINTSASTSINLVDGIWT